MGCNVIFDRPEGIFEYRTTFVLDRTYNYYAERIPEVDKVSKHVEIKFLGMFQSWFQCLYFN